MAQYRTQLALDRTTLAWIRTTITMATFGFGMVGFFRSLRQSSPSAETIRLHQAAIHFGEALIVIGMLALLVIAVAHWFALRRLRRQDTPPISQWPLSITLAVLLAVIGLAALWWVVGR
jgi:putative membrane protein